MPRIAVMPDVHSHVLAEFDCLDPLLATLRLDSSRLKVDIITCDQIMHYHEVQTQSRDFFFSSFNKDASYLGISLISEAAIFSLPLTHQNGIYSFTLLTSSTLKC